MSRKEYLVARVRKDIMMYDPESKTRVGYRGVKNAQGKWELRTLDAKGNPGKAVDRIRGPAPTKPVPLGPKVNPQDRLRRKRNRNAAASAGLAGGGAALFGGAGLAHIKGEYMPGKHGPRLIRGAGVAGRTGKLAMLGAVPFGVAAGVRHAQLKRVQRG